MADFLTEAKAPGAETDEHKAPEAAAPEAAKMADCPAEAAAPEAEPAEAADALASETVEDEAPEAEAKAPGTDPKPPMKRKRAVEKGLSMEEVAARIKRLQSEADEAEASARQFTAKAEAKRAEVREMSEVYARQQREAALAQLEGSVRKRPANPFFMYCATVRDTVEAHRNADRNKKLAEMWTNLGEEEKQKYKDMWEKEMEEYKAWGASEEGKRILQEREQILRKCKAAKDELAAAAKPEQPDKSARAPPARAARVPPAQAAEVLAVPKELEGTPARRASSAEALPATEPTPAKQRRVSSAKASPAAEPVLDERVLEEAGKLNLLAELRNLAERPEVLALKLPAQKLLDTLQAKSGLVNAAKNVLLGA